MRVQILIWFQTYNALKSTCFSDCASDYSRFQIIPDLFSQTLWHPWYFKCMYSPSDPVYLRILFFFPVGEWARQAQEAPAGQAADPPPAADQAGATPHPQGHLRASRGPRTRRGQFFLIYTERQKKLITSSGRRSLKSTASKLIIFGHK